MAKASAFIPGQYPLKSEPLSRFIPPVPEQVVSDWLDARVQESSIILDPFGSQPHLAVEAARSGYRVIVTANNPVTRFMLELSANPPGESEMRAALAELAAARRGDERLEPHIRELYLTDCDSCGMEIEAQSFVWERDSAAPFAKFYTCPHCGESQLHQTNNRDAARAAHFSGDKLHRTRALERVAAPDDPDRQHVEEALSTYLPRALYALFTLYNKLDGLDLLPARRQQLEALLLSASDYANSLWAYPGGRVRPRLLNLSPKFYENNVWLALEQAIQEWAQDDQLKLPAVPIVSWPELPPLEGGISVFDGRLKDLVLPLSKTDIQAVFSAIPRPNQAFWTLSALWSGWLWGKDALRPYKSVLRRRRYDWSWHCTALHAIFDNLSSILREEIPFLGLIAEAEPGFISAVFVAAENAGFHLSEYAFRSESSQAQFTWTKSPAKSHETSIDAVALVKTAVQAALNYLKRRAEPANYMQIHTAAHIALAEENCIKVSSELFSPAELYTEITNIVQNIFLYRAGFLRLGGSEKALDVGQWWLKDVAPKDLVLPLADRVEMETVRLLLKKPVRTFVEIDREVCAAFPGLLTPSGELVYSCLDSYGVYNPERGDWQLRHEDQVQVRKMEITTVRKTLAAIGLRLGYSVRDEQPLIWQSADDEIDYVFYILASAAYGEIIQTNIYPVKKSIIVLPGSRANIVLQKQKTNMVQNQILSEGWRFLKFRHVYALADNPLLNRENLGAQLSMDPIQDATLQMRLL